MLPLLITGCVLLPKHHEPLVSRAQWHMGTTISVSVPKGQLPLSEKVFSKFHQLDLLLSNYISESEVSRHNRGEAVSFSEPTARLLKLSEKLKLETQGYFDISQGMVKNGWDFGGIGKGFAVDEAIKILKQEKITSAIVAASGDIRCLHACNVAVRDPFSKKKMPLGFGRLQTGGWGITTSGRDLRDHINDPKSSFIPRHWMSVTLMSQTMSNAELDAWATALFAMPPEIALEKLRQKQSWTYLVVAANQEIYLDAGWLKLFEDWDWRDGRNDKNIMIVQPTKNN